MDFESYDLENNSKPAFEEYLTKDELMEKYCAYKEGCVNNNDPIQNSWIFDFKEKEINDLSCRRYIRQCLFTDNTSPFTLSLESKSPAKPTFQRIKFQWNFHGQSEQSRKSVLVRLISNLNPDDQIVYEYTFDSKDDELYTKPLLKIAGETMHQMGLEDYFKAKYDNSGKLQGFFICINVSPDQVK
ncbi:hypothetical protein TVAG_149250 [Trichomonas vaginalis G3]|uniref:Uncharacterized protein n=1 Tax=Trichomonas vaginalis (strain ATCC PRA-98 / G3) TaxID=412133 RepID=A2ELJ2_TRIV3|nr:hypothetical protein TVAGG3_0163410 [Trichomonas vaginalis G3]EAY06439.1 hypothetical protein TVAG_149250 [Trichomonas vaginalis G3]KAI5548034.1 hypothetical protein TVAGG3_0163410 [Trichomonas vaginalis G3]|eukprot:XP_001318662.1 hypothetical protein [Trichomonas vaginalis G3]